jgi:hypothetical protein
MNQTQTAQPFASKGIVLQVRDQDTFFGTDDDLLDSTVAVDQQANLAVQFQREFNQAGSQFGRTAFICRDTASVESFDCLKLTLLQTCKVSIEFVNGDGSVRCRLYCSRHQHNESRR